MRTFRALKSACTVLLRCLCCIVPGIVMLSWPRQVASVLYICSVGVFLASALIDLIEWIGHKPRWDAVGRRECFSMLGNAILVLVLACFPVKVLSLLPLIFGIWIVFNALIKTVTFVELQKNRVQGRLLALLSALISYGFGLTFVLHPTMHIASVIQVAGIYLILYGATNLGDVFRELLPRKKTSARGFRMPLPVWLAALIPYNMIRRVNDLIEGDLTHKAHPGDQVYDGQKEDTPPDLEVFVHVAPEGSSMFGHVDICFEGTVLTYGCYDDRTKWLLTALGEGHLIIIDDRDSYIPFCIKESNKTIFGFGLRLTEEQKQSVRKQIGLLTPLLIRWYPDGQLAAMGKPNRGAVDDYASRLYEATGARFYKFRSGRFKTYFVLGTNCVLLADRLIGASGSDIIHVSGIITPGTYYDYLNRQYLLQNSNVISRHAYTMGNQREQIAKVESRLKRWHKQ